jgi:hypothetical protein
MKKISSTFFLIVTFCLHAQEPLTDEAVLLEPIVREPVAVAPAEPQERLVVPPENILESEVVYCDGQKFTLQQIVPVELEPIPEPPAPKPLTEEQLAARAARLAAADKQKMLILSGTVYDSKHTLLRWTSQGEVPVRTFQAWSNVNFHQFTSLQRFKKKDTIYSFTFWLGDEDTVKTAERYARFNQRPNSKFRTYTPPTIPTLPADSGAEPTFQVISGEPTAADLEPIYGLHEIYKENHQALIAETQRINAVRAQQAAERLANPPDPKPDIIIQYWNIEKPATNTNEEGTTK